MRVDEALNLWRDHLIHEKRAPANTTSAYLRDVGTLVSFLAAKAGEKAGHAAGERPPPELEAVEIYALRGWLGQLARTHAPSSVARKIAAVRTWMRWLHKRGHVAKNPGGRAVDAEGPPSPADVPLGRRGERGDDGAQGRHARSARPRAPRAALRVGPARERGGVARSRRHRSGRGAGARRRQGEQGARRAAREEKHRRLARLPRGAKRAPTTQHATTRAARGSGGGSER